MLVKAKWNVKDAAGWHSAGDVFETSDSLGSAVEVIVPDKPKRQTPEKEPVKEPEKAEKVPEKKAEAEQPKQRTATRRKTGR